MYRTAQQVRWDNKNALDFAKEKAEQQGHQQGHQQGLEQGLEQGIEIGEHKKALEMACKLKAKGMPIEEIAELTSFTLEEIEKL